MFERFQNRSHDLERLDKGEFTAAEYRRWQTEMCFIHRLFGEVRALKNSLLREIGTNAETAVSILDVGAGSGELLRAIRPLAPVESFLCGAELNADGASEIRRKGFSAVRCDGLRLPFADRNFDHAICTLLLHHLSDEDAAAIVAEMARVSKGRIFAVDLNRIPAAYYVYKTVGKIFLQQLTLNDGLLSILRSRTPDELRSIGEMAGLHDVRVDHSRVNRLILSGSA